jgi:hypothetical protein
MLMVPSASGAGRPADNSSRIACAEGLKAHVPVEEGAPILALSETEVVVLVYVIVVNDGVIVDTKVEEVRVPAWELV